MKGTYIRQQRKRLGLSQPALGTLVGTDGTSVSRWERGTVEPNGDTEERLRAVFAGRPLATQSVEVAGIDPRIERALEKLDQMDVFMGKLDRIERALAKAGLMEEVVAKADVG